MDRLLGPFRRTVQFSTNRVKDRQPGRRSVDLASPELLEQRVCPARGPGANQQCRELSGDRIVPRRERVRLLGQRERFLKPALLRADGTERAHGKWEALIDFQDPPQFGFRVLQPASVPETNREMVAVQNIQRILLKAARHRFHRLWHPSDRQQVMVPVPKAHVA